ncbi:hypothetical protein I7I53_11580 [Histoplasma capsulatum var. duboisii H88]|uniref:Uncharacterized protein n=1 Tax=Ajellomyces capsulatus (strain H88) TaxID=544711 RepID=A0A8A1LW20_AJEC8|nr:hypothetical protein I7I53_11580 [Histoplasma capsulatum var. duboisii H88]
MTKQGLPNLSSGIQHGQIALFTEECTRREIWYARTGTELLSMWAEKICKLRSGVRGLSSRKLNITFALKTS